MSGEKARYVFGLACLLLAGCASAVTGTSSAPTTEMIAPPTLTDTREPAQASTVPPTPTLAPMPTSEPPALQFQCGSDIQEIAYSPDGTLLAALGQQHIFICDMSTLSPRVTLETESEITGGIDWSPQGTRLVAGLTTGQVRIWDTATWQEVITYQASDAKAEGWDVAWSPDGYRLLTTGVEVGTRIWHASTGDELLSTENSYLDATVAWSPDGKHFVMSNSDSWKVLVKDSATGQSELQLDTPYYSTIACSMAWSPDGTRFVVGYSTGEVTMFDADTAEILLSWHPNEVSWSSDSCSRYYNPTWSPDGKWLASVSSPYDGPSNIIYIWDTVTGQELAATGSFDGAISLDWSPDGQYLVGGMENGAVSVWEPHRLVHSPDPLPEVSLTAKGPWYVFMAAFMPDTDPYLWAINADGTGLTKLSHRPILMDLAVQPATAGESNTLIAFVVKPTRVSEDHALKIVTLPSGEVKANIPLWASDKYNTYTGWASMGGGGLVWSPDGSKLAFAGARNASGTDIWLYDANTGAITRITTGRDNARPLGWSPDGHYLIYERFIYLRMESPEGLEVWSARTDGTREIPLPIEPGATFLGWRGSTEGIFASFQDYGNIQAVNIKTGASQTIANEEYDEVYDVAYAGEHNTLLMTLTRGTDPEPPLILIRDGERIEIPGKQIDGVWWDSALDLFVGWTGNNEKYYISPLGQYVDRPQPEDFRPAEWSGSVKDVLISPDKTLWAWCYRKDDGDTQLWIGEPMAEPATKISSSFNCDYPNSITWSPDSQSLIYSGYAGLWIARRPDFKFTQIAENLPTECYGDCDYIGAWIP